MILTKKTVNGLQKTLLMEKTNRIIDNYESQYSYYLCGYACGADHVFQRDIEPFLPEC